MNLRAEAEDQIDQQAAQQQKVVLPLAAQIQIARVQIGRGKQRPRDDRNRAVRCDRRPVQIEQDVQIQRVQRDVFIAAQRAGIQIMDPDNGAQDRIEKAGGGGYAADERADVDQSKRAYYAQQCVQRAPAILCADQVYDDGKQTERREQHRLRLDQHRRGERDQRRNVFILRCFDGADADQQREHRIDLPPRGGIDQRGGVQKVQRGDQRSHLFGYVLASGVFEDQRSAQQIAEDRNQLEQQNVRAGIYADAE